MGHALSRKRIFVVDDEPEIVEFLRRLITSKTNHEVVPFSDPLKALEEFKKTGAHLVVSDISMPGMDGITLLGHIKAVCPETEVVILTGEASVKTAVGAIEHRAYDYLQKPVAPERLLRAIGNALSRQELGVELTQTTARVAQLNKELRRRVRDQVVRVTPLERLAMAAVMAHVFEASLDGHLSRARAALETLPGASPKSPQGWALRDAIEGVARSIQELSSTIGAFRLERRRGDLTQLAREEIQDLAELFPLVDVTVDAPEAPIAIDVDAEALATALGHLMENAVTAVDRKGTIRVAIAKAGGSVTVIIKDDGPGFPPEAFASSPMPFLPGGPAAARWLGLALARLIATAHGGGLELSNHPEGGSQVTLSLPCAE